MASSTSTRGQVWFTDFIIGGLIFITVLVIFFIQLRSIEDPEKGKLDTLLKQASAISNELLTPGYPDNWPTGSVVRIGITDNHRINQSKLDRLQGMTYVEVRALLRISDDFYLFLEDRSGCIIPLNATYGFGHPSVSVGGSGPCRTRDDIDLSTADATNLVPITRFVIYNANPIKLTTYVWK